MSIIRKTLGAVSVSGLMFLGVATFANPIPYTHQSEPGKQSEQKALKSIAGKVAAIETGGKAFKLAVSVERDKTKDFVRDKNTKIQGQINKGNPVNGEYQ